MRVELHNVCSRFLHPVDKLRCLPTEHIIDDDRHKLSGMRA